LADLVKHVLTTLITLLLSVSVHEYAHALAAYKLGDDTAARQGRLTLNPIAHADPIGTLLLPILGALSLGGAFGWGRPVPYVPNYLTRRLPLRAAEAIIAFAGPFANLVLATLTTLGLFVLVRVPLGPAVLPVAELLQDLLIMNLTLFFFNLLPVPPLDGSKILAWLFGQYSDRPLAALASLGVGGLILAVVFGGYVIRPFVLLGLTIARHVILLG
jgi:Zn-dependent protease